MRRPRVIGSILRRTDVWATPLWTQSRLRWLRTLGLPCAAPRECCGLPTGRHGHAPVPQPPPAHAGQSSWPRRAVGHPLLVCVVEACIRTAKPNLFWLFPIRRSSGPPATGHQCVAAPLPPPQRRTTCFPSSLLLPRRLHTAAWPPDPAGTGHQQHRRPARPSPAWSPPCDPWARSGEARDASSGQAPSSPATNFAAAGEVQAAKDHIAAIYFFLGCFT
jgi:hypothetical protein